MGETLQTEQVPRMSQLKMNLYWYACLEKEFSQTLSLVQVKAERQNLFGKYSLGGKPSFSS